MSDVSKDWQMCSKVEGQDRQDHLELSELESTPETCHLPSRHRIAHPRLCVQKYRRSAAGGGASEQLYANVPPRSLSDLHVTICHLLCTLVATQRPSSDYRIQYSLADVVNFVDDRIRAIQVEYITHYMSHLLQASALNSASEKARYTKSLALAIDIQVRCIRHSIFSQYLLRGAPKANAHGKFELKFNVSALRTALTHGVDLLKKYIMNCYKDFDSYISTLDEIMSYSALMHLCGVIMSTRTENESFASCIPWLILDSGTGFSAIEAMWNDLPVQCRRKGAFPKWNRVLDLVAEYCLGNYIKILKMLSGNNMTSNSEIESLERVSTKSLISSDVSNELTSALENLKLDYTANQSPLSVIDLDNLSEHPDARWHILQRCCMLPCVPVIRLLMLHHYNKAWMKNEWVTASDLSDLLIMENALCFAQLAGLPTSEMTKVQFKATSISSNITANDLNCKSREDSFVFGMVPPKSWRVDQDNVLVPSEHLFCRMFR